MVEKYSILVDDAENEEMLWHSSIEIAFVLNGYGVLFLNGEKYELQEEDIFVVNSYQVHRVELKEGSHLLSVLIAPGYLENLFSQAGDYTYDCKSFLCPEEMKLAVLQVKRQLARVLSIWSKSGEEFSELYMNIELAHLVECLAENFGKRKEKADKKAEHWLELVRFINESYQENVTLQMLAKREYMSESYFSRTFQKEMGVTFTEYLTEIRLSHALNLLARKDLTVTEVCFESGFRNVNSFIESFKQKYGKTPGQYRKEIKELPVPQKVLSTEEGIGLSALFAPLMKYIEEPGTRQESGSEPEIRTVKIHAGHTQGKVKPVWKQLINVGYAKDLLNAEIQKQVKQAASEIGFRYIRFHGILDDDMVLYRERNDGTPVINYHYVDMVLDFVLQVGLCPYIEFGYMPGDLAENRECSPFLRCSIISFPKDMEKWKLLVQSLVCHWQERYGRDELKKWVFSPIFHAQMLFFYQEPQWDRYMEWYALTRNCIKACDEAYLIASPPCMGEVGGGAEAFLMWCKERDCMPELLSLVSFHTADPAEETERNLKLVEREDAFSMAVSKDRNYLRNLSERLMPLIERYGFTADEVLLSEWNSNIWQRDLVNDTCYKAAFFFKNILENLKNYGAFGYWTLSDIMEEIPPAADVFHGGFGLFTTCGISKSGYQALCLLNYLGTDLIAQGDGYLVTQTDAEIQIFLYNYCHYETLYRYRHATNLSRTERYQVFCREREKRFCLQILGVEAGEYEVLRYWIDREHGSSYDAWVQMGAPASVNSYEKEYLMRQSYPGYRMERQSFGQEIKLEETLGEHEVMVIRIKVLNK